MGRLISKLFATWGLNVSTGNDYLGTGLRAHWHRGAKKKLLRGLEIIKRTISILIITVLM